MLPRHRLYQTLPLLASYNVREYNLPYQGCTNQSYSRRFVQALFKDSQHFLTLFALYKLPLKLAKIKSPYVA